MAIGRKASDIFLGAPEPPVLRIHGELQKTNLSRLSPEEAKELIYNFLTPEQQQSFERDKELDACFGIPHLGRFRINVHYQRGSVASVIRIIPRGIPKLDELGLPPSVRALIEKPRGFIMVTGPVSSGKSTTLAAMINHINHTRTCHVLTIEDPIEYLHENKNSIVEQREIGLDTHSFAEALKHVLRQDPDVIMIGEMRDLETIAAALTAAETGQCVLATLHTNDAIQSIERIIDVFPSGGQNQVRLQLSMTLQGVISQQLLARADSRGRVLAAEVIIVNAAIRNLIRKGDTNSIRNIMLTGAGSGMITMDQSIAGLQRRGEISYEAAMYAAQDPGEIQQYIKNE